MDTSIYFEIIGSTLLHATWISALYILGVYIVLKMNPRFSPSKKSHLLLSGMLLTMTLVLGIFAYQLLTYDVSPISSMSGAEAIVITGNSPQIAEPSLVTTPEYYKMIVYSWMIGALLFILKNTGAMFIVQSTKWTSRMEYASEYQELIGEVKRRMMYTGRKVRLAYSQYVTKPILVGIIKPVVLFPVGILTQLEKSEVEAIIAHELAHLIRKDQYINGLMIILETIFYFHPGIWWLNAQMRKVREEDCDDKVISIYGDRMMYVKTLLKTQEWSSSEKRIPALAIDGNSKSNFYNRIKRLLNMETQQSNSRTHLVAMATFALIGLFLYTNAFSADYKKNIGDFTSEICEDTPMHLTHVKSTTMSIIDTLPKAKKAKKAKKKKSKKITKIHTKENDKDMVLEMENGEIKELIIDGKVIPEEDYEKEISRLELSEMDEILERDRRELIIIEEELARSEKLLEESMRHLEDAEHNLNFEWLESGEDGAIFNYEMFSDEFPNIMIYTDSIMKSIDLDSFMRFPDVMKDIRIETFPHGSWSYSFGDDDRRRERIIERRHHNRLFPNEEEGIILREFHPRHREDAKLEDIIGNQLNRDGFLLPDKENKVLLTGKYLKINGEKQPSNIWNKYKSLFEEETGVPLNKKSRLEFSIVGTNSNKRYKAF